MKKALLIIFSVLAIDQIIKIWVKTHMLLGEQIHVIGNFFSLYFIENNGMAYGMELSDGVGGKLFLSVFRIFAVAGLTYWLFKSIKEKADNIFIISLSLVIAGAFGNVIDSLFYGLIFSASYYNEVATMFPPDGGYAGFLHGKVVDMFYVELWNIHRDDAPSWIPKFVFGKDGRWIFFRPIFNFADAAITCGLALMIIFQKRIFSK